MLTKHVKNILVAMNQNYLGTNKMNNLFTPTAEELLITALQCVKKAAELLDSGIDAPNPIVLMNVIDTLREFLNTEFVEGI